MSRDRFRGVFPVQLLVTIGFALMVALAYWASSFRTGQGVLVGVLEEGAPYYVGDVRHRRVRAVFRKSGDEWTAFQSTCPSGENCLKRVPAAFPKRVTWTVTYEGRSLGIVQA